jgi:AMP deaminase
MREKFKSHPDDVVAKDGTTLGELAKQMDLDPSTINVNSLDIQADESLFNRFDHFNAKYNPLGNSALRTIFLKSKNDMGGRYFAELAKILLRNFEREMTVHAELRLSIYGNSMDNWQELAGWVVGNKLFSESNRYAHTLYSLYSYTVLLLMHCTPTHTLYSYSCTVLILIHCTHTLYSHSTRATRYLVQTPRIYRVFRKIGKVASFQEYLDNIFQPLFECTLAPADHPELSEFLENVSGFDSVDDESINEMGVRQCFEVLPADWTTTADPPYAYQVSGLQVKPVWAVF